MCNMTETHAVYHAVSQIVEINQLYHTPIEILLFIYVLNLAVFMYLLLNVAQAANTNHYIYICRKFSITITAINLLSTQTWFRKKGIVNVLFNVPRLCCAITIEGDA